MESGNQKQNSHTVPATMADGNLTQTRFDGRCRVVWPAEKEPALRGRSETHRAAVDWYSMCGNHLARVKLAPRRGGYLGTYYGAAEIGATRSSLKKFSPLHPFISLYQKTEN